MKDEIEIEIPEKYNRLIAKNLCYKGLISTEEFDMIIQKKTKIYITIDLKTFDVEIGSTPYAHFRISGEIKLRGRMNIHQSSIPFFISKCYKQKLKNGEKKC